MYCVYLIKKKKKKGLYVFLYFYLCKIIKYFFNTVLDALNCDFLIQIFFVYALVLFLIRIKLNFVQTLKSSQCPDLSVCVFSDFL